MIRMSKERSKRAKISLTGATICLCLLIAFEIWKYFKGGFGEDNIYSIITSVLGGILFIFVIIYFSYDRILKISIRALPLNLLFALPCFAIAVNNFPIIPFLTNKAYISGGKAEIFIYLLVCLGTGLFEELVFRGYIFMRILEKRRSNVKQIFISTVISSAVFGLVHLVNLFFGGGLPETLLQVGYSFLIGGMCSVVLLKTGNVWYSVLIHGIYNFAGGVIPRLGGGTIWDAPTVTITVILSIAVAVYVIISLLRLDARSVDRLFTPSKKNQDTK